MRRLALALCVAVVLSIGLPSHAGAATLAQTWGVGIEPFGVTIDPATGKVYVAISNHTNYVPNPEDMWIIDPYAPMDPLTSFIHFPAPQVMSVLDASLGRLFVTLTNNTLAIVDVSTRTIVGTVVDAGGPGVALDPATHRVYASSFHGLVVIDGATGAVLARTTAASSFDAWWMVAHDPARHRLFVTNGNFSGAPSLVVLDDADLSVVANIPLPAIPRLALTVDPGRGLVYVGGFSSGSAPLGSLYAIDESSFQITTTLDVGGGVASPISTTLVPGTNRLYVSNINGPNGSYPGNALVTVDTATFSVVERSPLQFQPGQSALHTDGRLYVAGFDARLLAAISFNRPPVVDAVTVAPSDPDTNAVLAASVASHDPDGDAVTLAYRWYRNGVVLPGETAATLDLSRSGNGDHGDTITVEVTASDGALTSAAVSASVVVRNSAPTLTVSLSDTTPTKRTILTATAVGRDADGDTLTYTFSWRLNGKLKETTTGASAASALDLRAVEAGIGDVVSVDVVVSDGAATAAANASARVTPAGR
jgi:hypothetical protein